jgi:DNA-binding transcriptional MocR family regulator
VGSGGVPSHFSSMLVYHLLSSGALEEHITKTLIPTYSKRYHILMATIEKYLHPFGVRVTIGQPYIDISSDNGKGIKSVGGYFTYLIVPSQFPPTEVLAAKAAKEKDLKFAFGAMFQVKGDDGSRQRAGEKGGFGHCMRLSWAWHEEQELVEGIRRIAEVLREAQEDAQLSGQPWDFRTD